MLKSRLIVGTLVSELESDDALVKNTGLGRTWKKEIKIQLTGKESVRELLPYDEHLSVSCHKTGSWPNGV